MFTPRIQERAKKEAAAKEREWLGKPPLPNKAGKKRSAAALAAPADTATTTPSGVVTSSSTPTDSPSARQPQTKRVRLNPVPPVIEPPGETDGGSPPYSDGTSSPIDVTGGGPDSPGSSSSSPAPSGIAAFTAAAAAATAASASSGNAAGAGNSGVSSFVSVLGPPPPVDVSVVTRRGRPMESGVNSASPREGNGNIGIASATAGSIGGSSGNGNSGGSGNGNGSGSSSGNSNNGSGATAVGVSSAAAVSGGGSNGASGGGGASTGGKGGRSSRAHTKPSTRLSRQPNKASAAAVPSGTSSSSSTTTTSSASTSASNRHSGNGGSAGSGSKGRGAAGACGGSNGGGVGTGGGGAHHHNQHQNNHNQNHHQHHVSTRSKRPRGGDADGGGRIGRAHPAPAPALSPPPTPASYANASHALAKLGIPVALPGGGRGAVSQQLHLQQTVQQLQATQHLASQQRAVSSGGNGSSVASKRSPTVAAGSLPPPCFMCGEDVTHWGLNAGNGEAIKCAHTGCERVFHVTCVAHLLRDAAARTPGGSGAAAGTWECPIHRCARCGADENGLQLGESIGRNSRGAESVNGGGRGYWGKGAGGGAASRSRRLWQCTWCSVAFCMSHLPPQLATAGRKARVADANQCVHCRSPSPR